MRISRRAVLRALGASALAGTSSTSIRARQSALATFPTLARRLRREADRRPTAFSRRGIELNPGRGALALSLDTPEVVFGKANGQTLPDDAILTFAIDVVETAYVTGELSLEPAADLRPGLRVSVLCDNLLVGAPMVSANEWGVKEVTDAAPHVIGAPPSHRVPLATWLLRKGRRYLTVAGPHFRPGGSIRSLRLSAVERPVESPAFTFALISDTHVRREGREDWMNRKMGSWIREGVLSAGEGHVMDDCDG